MAKIFLANDTTYVVADNIEEAADKYYQSVSTYPTSLSLFKETTYVLTVSTIVTITPSVSPSAAATDGASVSPSTAVYIKEGDTITLTASNGSTYTFSEWQDGNGTQLSTDNPYTCTATSSDISIVGIFTV